MLASVKEENGCRAWNDWRKQNPKIKIDLKGVPLDGKQLSCVNLSDADLRHTDFSGSILSNADLSNSSLYEANLSNSMLCSASLRGTMFDDVDLEYTNFEDAEISGAWFVSVDLSTCKISQAQIDSANGCLNTRIPMAFSYPSSWKKAGK